MPIINKSHNITEKVHLFLRSLKRTSCGVWSNNILNKKKVPQPNLYPTLSKRVKCKIFFGLKETVLGFTIWIRNNPSRNSVLQCCTDHVHETGTHTDTVFSSTHTDYMWHISIHMTYWPVQKQDTFLRLINLNKSLHPEVFFKIVFPFHRGIWTPKTRVITSSRKHGGLMWNWLHMLSFYHA